MHVWRSTAAAPILLAIGCLSGTAFAQNADPMKMAALDRAKSQIVASADLSSRVEADGRTFQKRRLAGRRDTSRVVVVASAGPARPEQVEQRLDAAFSLVPVEVEAAAPPPRLPAPRPARKAAAVLAYAEPAEETSRGSRHGQTAIKDLVDRHAQANNVSPALAHALVRIESNYNARATGRHGEVGLLQINPRTARAMGYKGSRKGLYDPGTNLAVGMKYLGRAQKLAGGNVCGALLRYNAGLDATRGTPATNKFCARVKSKMG